MRQNRHRFPRRARARRNRRFFGWSLSLAFSGFCLSFGCYFLLSLDFGCGFLCCLRLGCGFLFGYWSLSSF